MTRNTIQKARPERVIALEEGRSTYFTGRPCKHGHIAERFTVDASCIECRGLFREGYREEAKAHAQRKRDEALAADAEGTRAAWAKWQRDERQRNPEKFRARERKHSRISRQRYPQRKLAETRARQAAQIRRTPPWVDLKAIRDFYENCPAGHEVDHIIPLRGKTVSGLHVLDNLQYLPKVENRLKGNRFDEWRLAA